MKKTTLTILLIILITTMFTIISCAPPDPQSDPLLPDNVITPPETIKWQDVSTDFTQYKTNEYANASKTKTESVYDLSNDINYEVEFTVMKLSGNSSAGLGCVINYDNTADTKVGYNIVIYVDGYYSVDSIKGDTKTPLISKTSSSYIKQGYGVFNVIKIIHDTDIYTIHINDEEVDQFEDSEYKTGYMGYSVRINSQTEEGFPNNSVEAWFKMTEPVFDL